MNVSEALAAFLANTLPDGTRIADTARLVAENFDALLPLVTAGKLAGIDLTNGGSPALTLTTAQLTADAAVLALVAPPFDLQQRLTAAEAAGATLAPGFEALAIWDTAANLAANLPAIETLWRQGLLGLVRLSDSNPPPTMQLTAAQVAANIDALRAIGSPFRIELTDPGTPTITLPVWADAEGNYNTVIASIATPFTLELDGVLRANRVAGVISGINRASPSETTAPANPIAPFGQNSPDLLPTNLTVLDYQGQISRFIASLQLAVAAGKITSIQMRDAGAQILSLTPAQLTDNAATVALFTPNVQLSQTITAAQAATASRDPRFANFTVEDTFANILANIPALDALARDGQLAKVRFTESTPNIVLTAAQLGQAALVLSLAFEEALSIRLSDAGTPAITLDADSMAATAVRTGVLARIAGDYTLTVTGPISATRAAAIANEGGIVLDRIQPFTIADFNTNVFGNAIGALRTLAAAGKITAIDLLNVGIPALGLSAGQVTSNAGVLALIADPVITGTAPATVDEPIFSILLVTEMAAYRAKALAGTLGTITFFDHGPPNFLMTAAELAQNLPVFGKIASTYTIQLSDAGATPLVTIPASLASAANLAVLTHITNPSFAYTIAGPVSSFGAATLGTFGATKPMTGTVDVVDFGNVLPSNLAGVASLIQQGHVGAIRLLDTTPARLPLTAAQILANPDLLDAIASPYSLSQAVGAASAASVVTEAGVETLTVFDTAANITANLASLQALAVRGTLVSISGLTGTIVLSAAQVGANAQALLRAGTGYSIALNDGGTPTITLQHWQVGADIATLLNRITSSYTLVIDGPIRPLRVSTLVDAGAAIYNRLAAGSLHIRDYPTNLDGRLDDLQILVNAGKIAEIDTRGGRPVISMTAAEQAAHASLLAAINTPFTLSQRIAVAEIAAATLSPGFRDFIVEDSVANVLSGLSQIQSLAAAGRLGRLLYTDAAPRLSLSAASLTAGLQALAAVDVNAYPIELTDAGTPMLTLPAHLLSDYYVRNNVLDAIATPWQFQVTGRVTADAAAAIAAENNNVKSHLAGKLVVAGFSFDLGPYLGHLHVLNQAGLIDSIDMLDAGAPTFQLTGAEAAAVADVLAMIPDAYVLQTETGSIAETDTAQLARLALTGFDANAAIDIRDMAFAPAGLSFSFAGGNLTVLRDSLPVGTAALTPAGGVTYDSHSFYIAPDGTGGTRIRATQAPLAVTDTTDNVNFVSGGDFYDGVVGYLQRQFINPTGHSVNVAANIPNVFLHGGGVVGGNALQALSGNNVLDGGVGSNFLVGGTIAADADTFFLDGRGGQVSWGTVVNFLPGDAVTFWGWNGNTNFDWFADAGAPGFQGATIHARLGGGSGAYDASITFAGISLPTAQAFTFSTGNVGGNSYAYFQYT